MDIQITTRDRGADIALFNATKSLSMGDWRELGKGIKVTYDGTCIRKGLDFPNIISATITFSAGVGSSLVASAVWEWLKGLKHRPERIEIDKIEVEFEEGTVKRLVAERFTRETKK